MAQKKKITVSELEQYRSEFVYNEFVSKLLVDFAVDLTADKIIEMYDISGFSHLVAYSSYIENATNWVFEEDMLKFKEFFNRERLVNLYSPQKMQACMLEFRYKDSNGEVKWCESCLYFFKKKNNICAYVYIKDNNAIVSMKNELIRKAELDSLTEVNNKLSTEETINKFLLTYGVHGTHALIVFDIDNFKNINSSYGHIFGDVVLVQTARKAKELFRKDDILGRIGGDEFVVFMKNLQSKQIAYKKAEEMLKSLEETFNIKGGTLESTASIGIAFYEDDNKTYQELLREADLAMYYCKNSGKNKFAVYSKDMDDTTLSATDKTAAQTLFEHNASEYIFRALRDNEDRESAFTIALELAGRYFDIDHAAIYNLETGSYFFSYSKKGAKNRNSQLMDEFKITPEYLEAFSDDMLCFKKEDLKQTPFRLYMLKNKCSAAVHFAMVEKGKVTDIFQLTRYDEGDSFTLKDTGILRNISNILSIYLSQYRAQKRCLCQGTGA